VLGLPIEESDLHIDDKHCVHEGAEKKRGAVRSRPSLSRIENQDQLQALRSC
jgi:hypothetical protein